MKKKKEIDTILNTPEISHQGFDRATYLKTVDGINVYVLSKSIWKKHHKYGIFLAIVKEDKARMLEDKETIYIFCY